jgi:transcriptional regulator with AAA-type ATPase domain
MKSLRQALSVESPVPETLSLNTRNRAPDNIRELETVVMFSVALLYNFIIPL